MFEIAVASNALGALLFAILGAVLLLNWKPGLINSLLVTAALVSAAWLGLHLAYYLNLPWLSLRVVQIVEVVRDGAWFACLLAILDLAGGAARRHAWGRPLGVGALCLLQVTLLVSPAAAEVLHRALNLTSNVILVGFLILGIVGLVLVEQLFRNTRSEQRWMIKLFCFGLGGVFVYDIFLYSHAVLFNTIVADLWNVRGAINAFGVPLMALSVARNPQWKSDLFISRQVVFHSTAVILVGAYLLLMAGVGYYIKAFGGTWGGALQALFFFAALMVLVVLMTSSQVRAQAKVFLVKHFYRNKYEYREEWLNFTRTLTESEGERRALEQAIVRAIAGIVDCRWGTLWLRHESNQFVPVSEWHVGSLPRNAEEPVDSQFARYLESSGWIVDLDEYARDPGGYVEFVAPEWLRRMTNAWLVLPLQQKDRLLGFIVLSRSLAKARIDWEDRDLLKTVAQQAVGYLALLSATEDLAQARQFEAYNRLSAFVVHDLKNLSAQLSLVIANAERFRHNQEFIDDALTTVANAVTKTTRMLASLRAGRTDPGHASRVDLAPLLEAIVDERRRVRPVPALAMEGPATVYADRALLAKAIGHLVQNAQEATAEEGAVRITLRNEGERAVIEVSDDGCGMEPEFIRDHLFRPFDTTKGNAGMGIGVFEARQIVTAAGGDISVTSTPHRGTTFTVRLPLAGAESGPALMQAVGNAT